MNAGFFIRFLLIFVTCSISFPSWSQGWRAGEKQVRVYPSGEGDWQRLRPAFQGDMVSPTEGLFYLVDKEIDALARLGIPFRVEIDDLNMRFAGFWDQRDAYHSYQEILALMDSLALAFPSVCSRVDLGTSAGGRVLAVLKISDNPLLGEAEPRVLFDGGIHGDELIGPENIIRFARDLCLAYGVDPAITELVDNREIYLWPMVNPDGRVSVSRYNDHGVDINRDMGYMWGGEGNSTSPFSQPESKVYRDLLFSQPFSLHISLHGGTEIISFPWSYRPDPSPAHDANNSLAALYSAASGYANLPYGQGYNSMYAIFGSTKDLAYGCRGMISWSLEVSTEKQPPASQIEMYYNWNKAPMLAMIGQAGMGINGLVTDSLTGAPVAATITIGNGFPVYSDPILGDFYQFVLPGTYDILIRANGYQPKLLQGVSLIQGQAVDLDVALVPMPGHFAWQVNACTFINNTYTDEGSTFALLGPPDSTRYSLGTGGSVDIDLQSTCWDGPGPDFTVFENDANPESYAVYASASPDGPWAFLGNGSGNTDFDLNSASLSQARYLRLVDDGLPANTAANAGADIDAVKRLPITAPLHILLFSITNEEISGDMDGYFDAGESHLISLSLVNTGMQDAINTSTALASNAPFIAFSNSTLNFDTLFPGIPITRDFLITLDNSVTPGQAFTLLPLVTANNGAYATSFLVNYAAGALVEDWETGNFLQFNWQMPGNQPWTIVTANPYQGSYCARSGAIDHEEKSRLEASFLVSSQDSISFYRKVSSEEDYDFLRFFIDGLLMDQWSGTLPWARVSYPVAAGLRDIAWEYAKDQAATGGSDCAWIDQVELPNLVTFTTSPGPTIHRGSLLAYPNPGNQRLILQIPDMDSQTARIRVCNGNGQVRLDQLIALPGKQGQTEIEVSHWPAGLYIISVYTSDNQYNIKYIQQ